MYYRYIFLVFSLINILLCSNCATILGNGKGGKELYPLIWKEGDKWTIEVTAYSWKWALEPDSPEGQVEKNIPEVDMVYNVSIEVGKSEKVEEEQCHTLYFTVQKPQNVDEDEPVFKLKFVAR